MNPSVTRGRVPAACGIVILSLAFLFAPAVAADRPSGGGQFLLWLLGLKMARERPRIDINSATVEELRAVPGMERHQALRIVAQRPYAKLEDLARADLSPITIERLARFLVVGPDWPSALPDPAGTPRSR
jgi:helix-hairpin-helix protein